MNALDAPAHTDPPRGRIAAVDRAKGLAILGVIGIHSRVAADLWFSDFLVNRSVPLFLVLFGVSSELWWRDSERGGASTKGGLAWKQWLTGRLARLLVPVWATWAIWWAVVGWHGRETAMAGSYVVATFLGLAPWIGTSWFVTALLQLVLLFPLLRRLTKTLGLALCLAAAGAAVVAAALSMGDLDRALRALTFNAGPGSLLFFPDPGPFYYVSIFAPVYCWHVLWGVLFASFLGRFDRVIGGLAGMVWLMAALSVAQIDWPLLGDAVGRLADPALAALVLALMNAAWFEPDAEGGAGPRLGGALAWLGNWSWGIYLGHSLILEILLIFGVAPQGGSLGVRAAYAGLLILGGIALALVGQRAREAVGGRELLLK
jgi:peptidoglycan/LPS O-acetylase OafA/YrhL